MISIDSNIFIYWLERNPEFYEASAAVIKQVYSGDQIASCSVLVLAEIYDGSSQTMEAILKLPNLSIIPTTEEVAELSGKLRYTYTLKVIDAIHAASALHSGASSIITNDIPFSKKKIPGLAITLLTKIV
ncbi:MAG TPA: PIN domain-containing protein [Candidatus Saccharimonadales bacterium]|nr:PIN domain-containing protein [Candidatus Saccharimonadales bacterium]